MDGNQVRRPYAGFTARELGQEMERAQRVHKHHRTYLVDDNAVQLRHWWRVRAAELAAIEAAVMAELYTQAVEAFEAERPGALCTRDGEQYTIEINSMGSKWPVWYVNVSTRVGGELWVQGQAARAAAAPEELRFVAGQCFTELYRRVHERLNQTTESI